jgi:hypothetical protein
VREIRTLRAMWRALETEPRQFLSWHAEENLGYKPSRSLRAAAPVLDPYRPTSPKFFDPAALHSGVFPMQASLLPI